MDKNYIWDQFDDDIHKIDSELDFSKFKTIIGIAKGGLPLAVKLSNISGLPLEIVRAKSYKGKTQKKVVIEQFNCIPFESPILLVDDVADNGYTLQLVKEQLEVWKKDVTTLTLFYKPHSIIKPNYYLNQVSNTTWVNFPWE